MTSQRSKSCATAAWPYLGRNDQNKPPAARSHIQRSCPRVAFLLALCARADARRARAGDRRRRAAFPGQAQLRRRAGICRAAGSRRARRCSRRWRASCARRATSSSPAPPALHGMFLQPLYLAPRPRGGLCGARFPPGPRRRCPTARSSRTDFSRSTRCRPTPRRAPARASPRCLHGAPVRAMVTMVKLSVATTARGRAAR